MNRVVIRIGKNCNFGIVFALETFCIYRLSISSLSLSSPSSLILLLLFSSKLCIFACEKIKQTNWSNKRNFGISLITKSNDILEAFGIVIGKEQNAVINDGIRLANQL
ncbi:hypothetical protein BpHYR1_010729 [Brachionus plicatilis]|uniref:Uncharacterized protein n=1 Tax=Brachionus plicatilis TaxID=10195 RepID=A0A3M7SYK2_BRAPC|nr:hypothetical protein BpHYR1_010729 [Brachionus plicatilis]